MTKRDLRTLRREWRKTVERSAHLARIGCPLLSQDAWVRAQALEAKIKEFGEW